MKLPGPVTGGRSGRRRLLSPQFAHAARVASAATLIIAVVYTGCVTALNLVVASRLTGQTDARLTDRLAEVGRSGQVTQASKDSDNDDDGDVDDAPLLLWLIEPGGQAIRLGEDDPPLPRGLRPGPGWPVTTSIGGSPFRIDARRTGSRWIAAGQSLAQNRHTEAVLLDSEIAAAPLLLVAMFLGSLTVGLKALGPVEQSRRRQLEFTADASHELRTPLSVISAEADVALAGSRAAAEYQAALTRIQGEGKRLRRIVEDLLWLARFDSQPPPPGDEPLDVATIAGTCADRFRVLAQSRSITIEADTDTPVPALIIAPPEWIDRLAGVLMDNACRYAGSAGHVRIGVTVTAARVSLAVEDSGPGIPDEDRKRLFDRFHRAVDDGQGAGLGLAIADSIVRSTGGRWNIGRSQALGGARMEVSWHPRQPRHLPAAPGRPRYLRVRPARR
ncbi:MAG: sensor histidine kinase [Streptosporangiaceae bacterium]